MKYTELDKQTTEKLESELKKIKSITIVLIGILILLLLLIIFGLLFKDKNSTFIPLIAVLVSCSLSVPFQFINMKKIKTELHARNQ